MLAIQRFGVWVRIVDKSVMNKHHTKSMITVGFANVYFVGIAMLQYVVYERTKKHGKGAVCIAGLPCACAPELAEELLNLKY